MKIKKCIHIYFIILLSLLVVGCSSNPIDPEVMLEQNINRFQNVNSYKAEMTVTQTFGNHTNEIRLVILQNMEEKSFIYTAVYRSTLSHHQSRFI